MDYGWFIVFIKFGCIPPFGHYHYTMKPQFPGGVPAANAVLSEIDIRMNKTGTAFVMAALASVVMSVYDLATDSLASTVNNA